MGLLADIYSTIDTQKRRLRGLLDDPAGTIDAGARRFREDNQANIGNMLTGFGLLGNNSVLLGQAQKDAAQKDLADYGANHGLAAAINVSFKPESSWLSAKSENGLVGGHVRDGALHISHSELADAVRGKGEGTKLYKALIDDAHAKGLGVFSDSTVELPAARVYNSLAKQGYDVKRLGGGVLEDGSVYGSGANSPAFQVSIKQPFVYPQQKALETAQRNAAKPIGEGGLGLPANNTPMDRAKAMGFNTEGVHMSRHGIDTNVLDSGKYAMAPFDAIGTHFGTKEAALDRFNRTVGTTEQFKGSTYPVLLDGSKPLLNKNGAIYNEEPFMLSLSEKADYGNLPKSNAAQREEIFSKNSIVPYVNDVEGPGSISYIAPPKNIRSRFAAFDPARRNEADILGRADPALLSILAGVGLLGTGAYSAQNK